MLRRRFFFPRRSPRSAAFAVAFLVCAAVGARAAKITVGKNGVDTIQEAVDLALANGESVDSILVPAGVYPESVRIAGPAADAQSLLTIRRKGVGDVLVQAPSGSAVEVEDFSGLVLEDLVLQSGDTADGSPALSFTGTVLDAVLRRLSGVPGDDIGVLVTGSAVVGLRFEECDFSGLLGIGYWLDGGGHTLVDCSADADGLNGFVLLPTSWNCRLEGCTAKSVSGLGSPVAPGLFTVDGHGHTLVGCAASGAAAGVDGFVVRGAGQRLQGCVAEDNGRAGFAVEAAPGLLQDCQASGNLFGFEGGGDGVVVASGSFAKNLSHGILLDAPGALLEGLQATANSGHGVEVLVGADRTVVRGCKMKGNGGEAVHVAADFCWLEGNLAKKGDGFVDAGQNNGGRGNKTKGGGQNDF